MRWRKAWLLLVIPALLLAAAAVPARADCIKNGKVLESGFDISVTPRTAYFHLGSGSTPTFYYKFTSTDPGVILCLSDAQMNNQTVEITGNAASCATSGTLRDGGTVIKVKRFKFE